jgi:hypothetical protein
MVADLNARNRVTEKRLIFTGQKISSLALYTASLEMGTGTTCKISKKNNRKIYFFANFSKNKKILGVKMTRKNSLQDESKTSIPIFDY